MKKCIIDFFVIFFIAFSFFLIGTYVYKITGWWQYMYALGALSYKGAELYGEGIEGSKKLTKSEYFTILFFYGCFLIGLCIGFLY